MKIPRFYQDDDLQKYHSSNEDLALSLKNHRHAIQVLRLKLEEKLILFNGKGGEYLAHIQSFDKRNSTIVLESFNDVNPESPVTTILNVAMIKPDKLDIAIQKAVELGVTTIQPIYTERSVIKIKANRLDKKMEHFKGVILAACEQSGRTALPEIKEPITLEASLKGDDSAHFNIMMQPRTKMRFADLEKKNSDQAVSLYIGPEGGFTDNEEKMMIEIGINTVNFGPRILRAETAVIASITAVQQRWGDI